MSLLSSHIHFCVIMAAHCFTLDTLVSMMHKSYTNLAMRSEIENQFYVRTHSMAVQIEKLIYSVALADGRHDKLPDLVETSFF